MFVIRYAAVRCLVCSNALWKDINSVVVVSIFVPHFLFVSVMCVVCLVYVYCSII